MLSTAFVLKLISVVCQYSILVLLLYFIYRVLKAMSQAVPKKALIAKEISPKEAVVSVLEANDSSLKGRRFAFTGEISLGRANDNDIIINDSYVSHHHAVIVLFNNLYVLEDLGSVNHTYLNEQEVRGRVYLQAGDTIRIGMVTMRFER